MKTVLITGINGFLGSHLAKTLCAEYEIVGLEYSTDNLFRLKAHPFTVYSSFDDPRIIFERHQIYAIIHAATVYRRDTEPIKGLIEANILMPVKLYELANEFGATLFLNTDSFFNNPKYDYSYLPDYTLSKKQVLEWLKLMNGRCTLVNMKLFHMYGPDDSPTKFISQMISKMQNNEPSVDMTPGEQTRDFVFIEDVVSAYGVVLKNALSFEDGFLELEVGTGEETSIKEMILRIKESTGSKTELNFGAFPYRDNEIMESRADNGGLRDLGWEPKFTVGEGILRTLA